MQGPPKSFPSESLTLGLLERQKALTSLCFQSAKKGQLGHELTEEFLSCNPVFKVLKSDHY